MVQFQEEDKLHSQLAKNVMKAIRNIPKRSKITAIFHPGQVMLEWGHNQQKVVPYKNQKDRDIEDFLFKYTQNNRVITFDDKAKFRKYFNDLDREYQDWASCRRPISIINDFINKNQVKTISVDNFSGQIERIIDQIPNQCQINVTIDNLNRKNVYGEWMSNKHEPYVKFEYGVRTQFITIDYSTYLAFNGRYGIMCGIARGEEPYKCQKDEKDNGILVNFYEVEPDVKDFINRYMLNNQGKFESLSKKELYKYLSNFPQELCQHIQNKSTSIAEMNYNNDTQAAYISLGLLSIVATILSPLYNYTISGKSIGVKNLPRICTTSNASALQQNTTNILRSDLPEDNNSNIAVILIPIFATLAIVAVLIAYCKSHHQRRSLNRNPDVSVIRNRRELEALEEGNGQQQLEERESLSIQEEAAQQLDSDNEVCAIENDMNDQRLVLNEEGELSSISDTSSHTSSSRSGAVSRTRSSSSTGEDSQRSLSQTSAPQKPQRILVQDVEEINARSRSSWPIADVRKARGCLGNGCY